VRDALLAWYDAHRRDLPWRRTRDPWAIWVSEVMLQQTRVESVVGYWHRFLARFPTPAALAAAPLDDLLALWAGLGYYSRARHLHRAAGQVVERHGGAIPDDPEAFGALAGVGRYTCGAVLSIAFGRSLPVVDGNVERVLCRVDRVEEDPRTPAVSRRLWARAAALAEGERPGDLNQALMELGATVCTPRTPRCLLCPVRAECAGAADAERLPLKPKRALKKSEHRVAALVRDEGGVWLARRPDAGLLAGMWELPSADGLDPAALGLSVTGEARVVEHAFTHRHWTLHVYPADGVPAGAAHVPYASLGDVALCGPALKALRAFDVPGAPRRRGAGR
jgi:A/G-specific adenine glycosylase